MQRRASYEIADTTIAAMAALKRKKAHERSLDQTVAQIGTLEQQIQAIESANINRETLAAMEKAGQAMKHIHNGLTPEKVDGVMYVPTFRVKTALSNKVANIQIGTDCGSRTSSAKRLSTPSRPTRSAIR